MSLENFILFFILLIPFLVFSYLLLTNKENIERVFSPEVLEKIKVQTSSLDPRIRKIIFLASILFMIIAISHPYIDNGSEKIKLTSRKILIALDLSGSMRSKDLYPNRLEFAKDRLKYLTSKMPSDEVMLIGFSNNIYLISPFTVDKDVLSTVADAIELKNINGATNFMLLAKSSNEILKNSDDKILIIISDGGDSNNLDSFKKSLKNNNITLYTILVGTKNGALVLDSNNKSVIKNGIPIRTNINFKLAEVAKATGGAYIISAYNSTNIDKLLSKINRKFSAKNSGKEITINDRVELFIYPLTIAIILLFISFISLPRKNSLSSRRKNDK